MTTLPRFRNRYADSLWAVVRQEYLSGTTAPRLEQRYGVPAVTIYSRARRHGWTKRNAAEARARAAADDLSELPGSTPVPKPAQVVPLHPNPGCPGGALLGSPLGVAVGITPATDVDLAALRRVAVTRAAAALSLGEVNEAERLVRIARSLLSLAAGEAEAGAADEAESIEIDMLRHDYVERLLDLTEKPQPSPE